MDTKDRPTEKAMAALTEPLAKRIANLFRRLGSEFEGEQLATIRAMKRLFASEKLGFSDVAIVIENAEGMIEERKYSDSDAEIIFARGMERGAEKARAEAAAPPEFYDAAGQPRWNDIALAISEHDILLWMHPILSRLQIRLSPLRIGPGSAIP
jgi:hypothetical protein